MEYKVYHLESESVLDIEGRELVSIEKVEGSPELEIPNIYIIDGKEYYSIEDYIYNTNQEVASAIPSSDFTEEEVIEFRESKKSHRQELGEYLLNVLMSKNLKLDELNKSQGHYRIHLPSGKKIDVWITTSKHTLVGSNIYNKGVVNLKKLINRHS